jgi:hypothetical protein
MISTLRLTEHSVRSQQKLLRQRDGGGSLLILSLYTIIICLVAAVLYVAVNNLEPNRRYASALKILIITLAVVAFLAHLTR